MLICLANVCELGQMVRNSSLECFYNFVRGSTLIKFHHLFHGGKVTMLLSKFDFAVCSLLDTFSYMILFENFIFIHFLEKREPKKFQRFVF